MNEQSKTRAFVALFSSMEPERLLEDRRTEVYEIGDVHFAVRWTPDRKDFTYFTWHTHGTKSTKAYNSPSNSWNVTTTGNRDGNWTGSTTGT